VLAHHPNSAAGYETEEWEEASSEGSTTASNFMTALPEKYPECSFSHSLLFTIVQLEFAITKHFLSSSPHFLCSLAGLPHRIES